ncbi:MAG: ribonuclease T2 family protein [Solirubrobacterales bacterium]
MSGLFFAFTALAQQPGVPGRFDYYVLSLSWSPTWCATEGGRRDGEQCGGARHYGFVVHGLWPQYAGGGYPAECGVPAPLPPKLVEDMLPLMPSRKLIEHEWKRHGSCGGLPPTEYFAETRRARAKVQVPAALAAPERTLTLSVEEIERQFIAANPGLTADAVSVVCRRREVAEVRICLGRDLGFRPCARDVRDRCGPSAVLPALR